MAEKKIKTKFPGIVGKTFDKLPASKQKEVVKFMKTIPEYANKTVTELKKIAKKVYKKLPTRKPKKNKREPLFDPSDRILARDGDVTMVNRPSKLKADPETMKALGGFKVIKPKDIKQNPKTGKLEESLITGRMDKPSSDTPVFDAGKGLPQMNKGGRVRSYRGYGKARRG
jgi:hypothetical protein